MDVEDDPRPERLDADRQLAQVGEVLPHAALVLQRADDEQKPPTAGAGHLRPGSTRGQRGLDSLVDLARRDTGGELTLGRPTLVHRDAQRVDVAVTQPGRRIAGEVAQL